METSFRQQMMTQSELKVLMKLACLKDDVISISKQALLSSQQTRDDYSELLELAVDLLFLGNS